VAAHAALRYMPSADRAPFWALSSIGGDRSVVGEAHSPCERFGDDRYIDRDSFAAGAELRTRVEQFKVFATNLSIELAPFHRPRQGFFARRREPLVQLHKGGGSASAPWRAFHRRLCRCRIRPGGAGGIYGDQLSVLTPRASSGLERVRARPDERTRALTVMHRGRLYASRIKSLLTNSQQKLTISSTMGHIRGYIRR